jgi:hypothetical protein
MAGPGLRQGHVPRVRFPVMRGVARGQKIELHAAFHSGNRAAINKRSGEGQLLASQDLLHFSFSAFQLFSFYSKGLRPFTGTMRMVCEFLRRKEVIQPQVPLRLPCYDFIPVTSYTLGPCPPCGLARALRVRPASMM